MLQSSPADRGGATSVDRRGPDRATIVIGAVAVGIVLILYLATAARDIVLGDSPELTGAAVTLGVTHPPGYPVWTILAHVFTLLPLGPLPFRVSIFSVAASVVAVALVYATAYRLGRSAPAAAAAALVLGFSPACWSWSLVPEVFPLNNALAAALVFLLLLWHHGGRPAHFLAAALIGGIGMANHQTIALMGPAVLFLMWRHAARFRHGDLLSNGAIAFAIGLLPYAYLPIAAAQRPPWSWGDLSSIREVIDHVLRVGYGSTQLVTEARFAGGSAFGRVVELARSFTPIEAALVGLGALYLYRHDRVWLTFMGLAFAITGPAFTAYANIDLSQFDFLRSVLERFFLLGHVVLAPTAALGVLEIVRILRQTPRSNVRGLTAITAAGAMVLAAVVATSSYADIDQSQNHVARTFAEDILTTARPGVVLLVAGDPVALPLEYLMRVERMRPDVAIVQLPLLRGDWYLRQVRRQYPDVVFPRAPIPPSTLRDLMSPNRPERFDLLAALPDMSMAATHGRYRRGLVEELRPAREEIDIDAFAAANDELLRSYRIPSVPRDSRRRWERLIQADYALAAYDVARVYELATDRPKAREWYERALAIYPDLREARDALARLAR